MAPAPDRRRPRAPRLTARCPAVVSFGAGRWEGETEDLATSGCRIVAHFPLRRGEVVSLVLRFPAVPFELKVTGTVAWASKAPPYRTGVAFVKGQEDDAKRFVRAVRAADPAVVPAASGGAPQPGEPAPVAPEEPGHRARPRPTLWRADAPGPRTGPSAADGARWARARPPQAQTLLDLARTETAAGNVQSAMEWLRAALQLAPGDAEIAAELGALAFRGRPRQP